MSADSEDSIEKLERQAEAAFLQERLEMSAEEREYCRRLEARGSKAKVASWLESTDEAF